MAAIGSVALSGCTPVVRELRHSGGYPGYLMDQRFFNASNSKQLQLLRAGIIVAMASRVGAEYVRDTQEAEAFLNYLEAASSEINFMAGHIYEIEGRKLCRDLVTTDCDSHVALFESDMPLMEERILRLVVAALPQRRAARFLDSARSGDIMSAAWQALRLSLDSIDGARRGAAVQRSTLELRALLVQAQNGCFNEVNDAITTVNRAAGCLNMPVDSLPAREEVPMPLAVPRPAFDALFGMIRTSCGLLPVNSILDQDTEDEDEDEDADNAADQADGDRVENTAGLDSYSRQIQDRRKQCGDLAFDPRLRFGGLRGFDND